MVVTLLLLRCSSLLLGSKSIASRTPSSLAFLFLVLVCSYSTAPTVNSWLLVPTHLQSCHNSINHVAFCRSAADRTTSRGAANWPYSLEYLDKNIALVPQIQFPFHYDNEQQNDEQQERLKLFIMVDVFSPYHGNYLSYQARSVHGCAVVNVLGSYLCGYLVQQASEDDDNDNQEEHEQKHLQYLQARIPCSEEEAYKWFLCLPPFTDIVGIHCESDSGLEDSEKLGDWMRSFQQQGSSSSQKNSYNDYNYYNTYNPARRDKFQMIQQVINYQSSTSSATTTSTTAMKQRLCYTIEDAIDFFNNVQCSVVLKPTRGVASDGVHLCNTKEELMEAFMQVHCSPVFGSLFQTNDAVLLQQYIGGIEYAVDVVSKRGQHKVAAVYKYDKRPTNGGPFVYYATQLADVDDEEAKMAVDYVIHHVLKALDIQWGLTHTEVKVLPTSSDSYDCQLIEVNCRQHNTDFSPMANICIGYNALDMLLAAYLGTPSSMTIETTNEVEGDDEEEDNLPLSWDSFPIYPTLRLRGTIVHLVCHVSGEVQQVQHMGVIEELESFGTMEIYPTFFPPSYVSPTVDIRSDAGWVHLINDDKHQLQSDYDTIVNLMPTMFTV